MWYRVQTIFFLGLFFSCAGQQTCTPLDAATSTCAQTKCIQKDLDTFYAAAKKYVVCVTQEITSLPAEYKKIVQPQITTSQHKLEQGYQAALKKIKNSVSYGKNAPIYVHQIVRSTLDTLSTTIRALQDAVEHVYNAIATQQASEQQKKKAQEESKKAVEYQKKLLAFLHDINPVVSQLKQVVIDSKLFMSRYQKSPRYTATTAQQMDALTQRFLHSIEQLYQKYQATQTPVVIDNPSNYVVKAIRYLMDFYTDFLEQQLDGAMLLQKNGDFYPRLVSIAQQILGGPKQLTNTAQRGYDAVIHDVITQYFKDNVMYLYKEYLQKRVTLTYTYYKIQLTHYVGGLTAPAQQQVDVAENLYALIMHDNGLLAENVRQADVRIVQSSMGVLYSVYAQTLLKNLAKEKNKDALRTKIIAIYTQAADYFKKAQDSANEQLFLATADNLKKGTQLWKDSRKAQDQQAVDLLEQAQALFQNAGDSIDAHEVQTQLAHVSGKVILAKTQADLKKFLTDNQDALKKFCSALGTLSQANIQEFNDVFQEFLRRAKAAYQGYQTILNQYQDVAEYATQSLSAQVITLLAEVQKAASFFDGVYRGFSALAQATSLINQKNIEDVPAIQALYEQAIEGFAVADTFYTQDPLILKYVVVYPSLFAKDLAAQWSYAKLGACYAVHVYVQEAQSSQDAQLQLQYYAAALALEKYLPAPLINFLEDVLVKTGKNIEPKKVLQALQEQEQKARALSVDDWKIKDGSLSTTSAAESLWQSILNQYLTLYRIGYKEIQTEYVRVLQEYAQAYKAAHDPQHFPEVGLLLIKYQVWLWYVAHNDGQNQVVLKEMNELAQKVFGNVQALQQDIEKPVDMSKIGTEQEKVVEWSHAMERALQQQYTCASALFVHPEANQQNIFILQKKSDAHQATIYTYLPTQLSVTLDPPDIKLAHVYRSLAEHYMQVKDYLQAYPAYVKAQRQYQALNQEDKIKGMQEQRELSKTLYYAHLYKESAVAEGSTQWGGIQIPVQYAIKMYRQIVPLDIVKQFPSSADLNALSQQAKDKFTISLATNLFLYFWIKQVFGADQYPTLFSLITKIAHASEQEMKSNIAQLVTDTDKQRDLYNIMLHASALAKVLTDRVSAKKSSFVLHQIPNKDGSLAYALDQLYVPMPRFPAFSIDTQEQFYRGYPAVFQLYTWSAALFAPGIESVVLNGAEFVPGNDQQSYENMQQALVKTYLSQAYVYQSDLQQVKTTPLYKKLLQVRKEDMTVKIKDYMDLMDTLQGVYQNMIKYADMVLNTSLLDKNIAQKKAITQLVGQLYKQLGDDLQHFLVGDPRVYEYHGTVMTAIRNAYVNAIVNYGYSSQLYLQFATLCKQAGDLLVQQGNEYVASRFYIRAEKALNLITPQSKDIEKEVKDIALARLFAQIKAANDNMALYQDARAHGVPIKQAQGTVQRRAFDEIVEKYNEALHQTGGAEGVTGLDAAAKKALDDLKASLLDALIFYINVNVGTQEPDGTTAPGFAGLVNQTLGSPTVSPDIVQASQKKVQVFLQRNKMQLDSYLGVDTFMNQKKFFDGADFVAVIQAGFNQFRQGIASTNVTDQAIAYECMANFASVLYAGFSLLYMHDYLGGIPTNPTDLANAQTLLLSDIDTERSAMNAPAQQYFESP